MSFEQAYTISQIIWSIVSVLLWKSYIPLMFSWKDLNKNCWNMEEIILGIGD